MKIIDLLETRSITNFNNWVRYTPQSVKDDFIEYKKKETTKWQSRAQHIGARWPIFNTFEEFQQALDQAPIVNIDDLQEDPSYTKNHSIADIKLMVITYKKPRDVDRIIQGYYNNVPMPLPIILKGRYKLFRMAGNTRQSVARVLGITPRALLIDVSF